MKGAEEGGEEEKGKGEGKNLAEEGMHDFKKDERNLEELEGLRDHVS